MSFRKYAEYKDSGIEWLGEVPEHWAVSLLKRRYQVTLGKMLKSNQTSPNETEEFYLRAANIHWRGVNTTNVKRMWFTAEEKKKLKLCKGDLLVSEGGDVGRSSLWNDEIEGCYIQNSINRIRAREDADTRFLFHWMYFIKHADYIDMICNKATIAHFTVEKVEATPCVYPPLEEQKRIAAFLDKETTKIDTLIDKQEQLITLLLEKRQAIISHAVTRGLNPDVRMKDSGIEWLGEVPEHWMIGKVKYVTENLDKSRVPLSSLERGKRPGIYPYYGASGIIDYIDDYLFDEDTILFGEDGANLLARSTPLAFLATGKYWVNNHAHVLKARDGLNRFWVMVLENIDITPVVSGSAQPKLTSGALGNLNVVYPPSIDERREILTFLDKETAKINTLIEKCETAIELLKERRTALISAAVTGKIDVRDVG